MSGPRLARFAAGAPPLAAGAECAALFTDLHLDAARPGECEEFAGQLRALRPGARGSAVVVLGDLFDAYVGPEDWQAPPFAAVLAELRALAAAGARVLLLRGNRDVLLEPGHLPEDAGIEVADAVALRLGGRAPALLTHGDAYCLADRRYQFLRRTLRRPGLRRFLARRGPRFRRWLAARLRRVSRGEVARKPLEHLQPVPEPARAELEAAGAAAAVIGHLHRDLRLDLGGGLRLRVLPAWEPSAPPWDLAAVLDGKA